MDYPLHVAVWSLQSISRTSRCHQSRVIARSALKLIGESGDVETDADDMPVPVPAPERP